LKSFKKAQSMDNDEAELSKTGYKYYEESVLQADG